MAEKKQKKTTVEICADIINADTKLRKDRLVKLIVHSAKLAAHCRMAGSFFNYGLFEDVIHDVVFELKDAHGFKCEMDELKKHITIKWTNK